MYRLWRRLLRPHWFDPITQQEEERLVPMPVRKATPEETQAFYAKPVIVFGQKRPDSSKKNLKSSGQRLPQKVKVKPEGSV